ncbi:hypothetical protein HPP92_019140 [Vanilla planifolia]|uniref:Uncharacterized protein n=1 Tax=Vanilla planifolia TaxID=51239 RepID=A0A835Q2C8_VANPL|nr:hypothetical protein HPP92_019140 [Vanilla planifolia]
MVGVVGEVELLRRPTTSSSEDLQPPVAVAGERKSMTRLKANVLRSFVGVEDSSDSEPCPESRPGLGRRVNVSSESRFIPFSCTKQSKLIPKIKGNQQGVTAGNLRNGEEQKRKAIKRGNLASERAEAKRIKETPAANLTGVRDALSWPRLRPLVQKYDLGTVDNNELRFIRKDDLVKFKMVREKDDEEVEQYDHIEQPN